MEFQILHCTKDQTRNLKSMDFKSRFLNPLILKSMGFKSSKQSGCTKFLLSFWPCKQRFQGRFFGHFYISRVLRSFFRFQGYFSNVLNFLGSKRISIIFQVMGSFQSFFRFQEHFSNILGFEGITVIFQVLSVFQSLFQVSRSFQRGER